MRPVCTAYGSFPRIGRVRRQHKQDACLHVRLDMLFSDEQREREMRSISSLLIRSRKQKEADMRLDKYLKVSRLIKRRTVANEACDAGRVFINDRPAKASANVKAGDVITIQFGNKEVKVEVLDVQETVRKEEAKELFRYLS